MCLHTCETIFLMLWLPANTFFHNNVLSVFIGKTVISLFKVLLIKFIKGGEHKYGESLPNPPPIYQSLKKSSNFKTRTTHHRIDFYSVIMWTRKMYNFLTLIVLLNSFSFSFKKPIAYVDMDFQTHLDPVRSLK